ncbi:hypothetical protein OROHE_001032 [Orobanche hederae]
MDNYMCCVYGGDKQRCQTCGNFEHIWCPWTNDALGRRPRRPSLCKYELVEPYKCNICHELEGQLREIAPLPHDYVAEVPNEEVAEELNEDNNYKWEVDDDEESGKQIMKYHRREDDEDGLV